MRQTVISRKVGARMMTNPHPSHVSLVTAGANQQAFHAIRSALNTEDDMKVNRTKSATVAAAVPAGFGVMQFQFDAGTFKTQEDVTRWLDEGGYVDYTVEATDTGFSVAADAAEFTPGTVKKIDGAIPGVVIYAGEYTPETIAARAAAEQAEDAAETTTKTDEPGQQVSEEPGDTPPAAPGEPSDPVQPVATLGEDIGEEIADTPAETVEVPAERADQVLRQRGIYEIEEVGGMVNRLAWMVYDAEWSDLPPEVVEKLKSAAGSLLDVFVEMSTSYADQLKEFFTNHASVDNTAKSVTKTDAPAETPEPVEPAAPEPVTEPETPAPASALDAEAIAALVGKVVADALAPITSSVEEVAARVSEVSEEVSATKSTLDTRVGALERQGQTRKGADHVDPPEQQPAKRSEGSNNILRAMGSRHAE